MPTYVYRFVDTGETIEIQQAFTDESLTQAVHPETGEVRPVKKVFTPVGVTFKGNGFYKTDSRSSSAGRAGTRSGADGAKDGSPSTDSSSGSSESSSSSSDSSSSSSASSSSSSSSSTSGSSGSTN